LILFDFGSTTGRTAERKSGRITAKGLEQMTNITPKELSVLTGVATSEYQGYSWDDSNIIGVPVWTFSAQPAGLKGKAFAAVVGSLAKKGLVGIADDTEGETIWLTQSGFDAIKAAQDPEPVAEPAIFQETRLDYLRPGDVFGIIDDYREREHKSGVAVYSLIEIDPAKGVAICLRQNGRNGITGDAGPDRVNVRFEWRPYDDDAGNQKQFVVLLNRS
jgi:hypothetical protein